MKKFQVKYLALNEAELKCYNKNTYVPKDDDIGTETVYAENSDEAIAKAVDIVCSHLDGNGLCYLVSKDNRIDLFDKWNRLDEVTFCYFNFVAEAM